MIQQRGLNVIAKWEHFPCFEVEGKLWLFDCGGQDVRRTSQPTILLVENGSKEVESPNGN